MFSFDERPLTRDRFHAGGHQSADAIANAGYQTPEVHVSPQAVELVQKPYVLALTGHRPFEAPHPYRNNPNRFTRGHGGVTAKKGDVEDMAMLQNTIHGWKIDPKEAWRPAQDRFEQLLSQQVEQHGAIEVHTGMAMGADMIWARAAIKTQAKYGRDHVHVVADVPFTGQQKYGYGPNWDRKMNLKIYDQLLRQADAIVVYGDSKTAPRLASLYEKRNQGMFANADAGVAFIGKEAQVAADQGQPNGGTANGYLDIKQSGADLIVVHPEDVGLNYQAPMTNQRAQQANAQWHREKQPQLSLKYQNLTKGEAPATSEVPKPSEAPATSKVPETQAMLQERIKQQIRQKINPADPEEKAFIENEMDHPSEPLEAYRVAIADAKDDGYDITTPEHYKENPTISWVWVTPETPIQAINLNARARGFGQVVSEKQIDNLATYGITKFGDLQYVAPEDMNKITKTDGHDKLIDQLSDDVAAQWLRKAQDVLAPFYLARSRPTFAVPTNQIDKWNALTGTKPSQSIQPKSKPKVDDGPEL